MVRVGHSELIQAFGWAADRRNDEQTKLNADGEVSKIHEIYLVSGPWYMVTVELRQ